MLDHSILPVLSDHSDMLPSHLKTSHIWTTLTHKTGSWQRFLQTKQSQEHPCPVCICHAQCFTFCRTQVLGSHPKNLVGSLHLINFLPECFFNYFFSLSQLYSTMRWMALSVLSNMTPSWVFCWTHIGSFLWHCHILLQEAPHPAEREETMLHRLHFSASLGKSMTNYNLW